MPHSFESYLRRYAELIIRIGLNLQPDQKLMIIGRGDTVSVAPLVREVATAAYQAGARYVDVLWSHEQLTKIRLQHAPEESLTEVPAWLNSALMETAANGGAVLNIFAADPVLLADENPAHVAALQQARRASIKPFSALIRRDALNWCGAAAVVPGWAAQVFPDLPLEAAVDRLWQVVFDVCRLDQPDPVAAWETHIGRIIANRRYLTAKQYNALHFRGPGTDLTVGLANQHVWLGGRSESTNGITHTPNLPTEETFTMPHRDRVNGVVTASKPLSVGGALIDQFSLSFEGGVVQNLSAKRGEASLRRLIETDEGAARLGEVALVPADSPIAESGVLFFNTLFDENAASHVALGSAYASSVAGGATLDANALAARGANDSLIHVDFMIGSAEMDVDGITADGSAEAVMRGGQWAFDVPV